MTQKEREEGASHTLLIVRLISYQQHSLLSNIPLQRRPTHSFWSQVIDSFYGFCINDTDLQEITKTKGGLQKLKWLIFDCCTKTNPLRYIEQTHCLFLCWSVCPVMSVFRFALMNETETWREGRDRFPRFVGNFSKWSIKGKGSSRGQFFLNCPRDLIERISG